MDIYKIGHRMEKLECPKCHKCHKKSKYVTKCHKCHKKSKYVTSEKKKLKQRVITFEQLLKELKIR